MDTDKKENLKKTRDRRKRINRIKVGIILTITGSILISLIAIVCLIVSVVKLNNRLDEMEEGGTSSSIKDVITSTDSSDNIKSPESNEKTNVYLTFDDGPSDNTDSILDTLGRYNVKATFFLVQKDDAVMKDKIKRIASEGHSIGVHSYNSEVCGKRPACADYRFPGGSGNKVTNVDIRECIDYLNSQGINYYDWNVSSGDAVSNAYTADELVENVMKDVLKYKTSVVLLHDANAKGTTAEALPRLIEALQASNVSLLPITDDTPPVQHVKAK